VVVLTSEIGSDMMIEELAWNSASVVLPASYTDVEIHLGLCATDQLTPYFDANYIAGTKTLCFQVDSLDFDVEADEWFSVTLDDPYYYNGENNLLIEIFHNPCSGGIYCWNWNTGPNRSVGSYGPPGSMAGVLSNYIPYMMLSGTEVLEHMTFGSIKILWGRT
jgi:hypothetical protein